VLDFSLPKGFLRPLYRFYLHRFLPRIAGVVTGERDAYQYLGASIEKFPSGNAMCELLERSGLRTATAQPLSGGIVTIYCARR
jgi:demethylmenaquinone methyltransferase/2-methoxy-6-polyprenyl-1,4-benzoquinol methylase